MVDPVFKAPLPPSQTKSPEVSETASVSQKSAVSPTQDSVAATSGVSAVPEGTASPLDKRQQMAQRLNELKTQMVRYFWYSVGGMFLLGTFFGCAMSGSNPAPQKVQVPQVSGISARVIANRDIKGRMGICGSVPASQACLFYVLNKEGYDKLAEDFFQEVETKMQRNSFNLKRDNPLYAKTKIRPGYFAEIIVPAI